MQTRNGRRGSTFSLRLTDEERAELETMCQRTAGPKALGAWLIWAAKRAFEPPPVLPRRGKKAAIPELVDRMGNTRSSTRSGNTAEERSAGNTEKVILDLCAGTGAWSDPYRLAGYDVRRITLPENDVHVLAVPCDKIHGILCAPPCTEFSIAKNGHERDIRSGLETVSACLRLVYACKPVWWALENPVGLLSHYLGQPRDVWEPYEFGDPHTKATAVWGQFNIPERGPFVEPVGSAIERATAEERAITPDGFARAFFLANS